MPVPPHIVTSIYSLPLAAQTALAERLSNRLQRAAEAVCHPETRPYDAQPGDTMTLARAQADGMAFWMES